MKAVARGRITLNQRLRPLLVAVFLQNFVFWYAIEKLFMKNIGFSDFNIAVATIIFTTVTLVVNIPLGILADKWSRKGVLMLASMFLALSSLVCGLTDQVWVYAIGLGLWGVFLGCYSGAYESIVYDTTIEETGSSELYEYYYGRVVFYSTVALVVSSLISGVIGDIISLRADYVISVPLALSAIIPLYYFREPVLHKVAASRLMANHIREIIQSLRRPETLIIAVGLMLVGVSLRLTMEFGPLWLVALALPVALYGPAIALMQSAIGISGALAHRIKHKPFYIALTATLLLLLSMALTTRLLGLVVIAIALMMLGFILLTIVLSRYLHETIPSNIRVGTASFVTTAGYIVFLPIAALFGLISDRMTLFKAAWLIVATISLLLGSVLVIIKTAKKASAEPVNY